ncbi:uncharacterized protein LOC129606830 [Condylostylus longicornis]|uniref:uncharacterized protein LOC129606830 n=1 Tax=Condylostylus longicornis TaxID=2530218 RepID=UPI00244E3AEC|nr:uncharacterized protein LOC129606830 [Condylostylus longicornis]XP_055373382.1 uncharacterized protein LOC129606830 [Condylostylus longicornis]
MVRKKDKPRIIPEQDKRICASICFFQLTMVLSCVAIVYLSVAVYSPSFKAFKAGYDSEPVICQTIEFKDPKYCNWASCGEWCLTKTSGYCPQIVSTVRRNGTDIQFNNCTRINVTQCPQVDPNNFKKYNCNNGTICSNLHGLFNCSNGHCKNISEFMLCHHTADGPSIDPEKDNSKLNGYFECYGPKCTKIKKEFRCDRYCGKITTADVNVIIMQDNDVITADCEEAVAFNEANGNNPPIRISPFTFWKETDGMIMTSCMTVDRYPDKITATDCLNGTLLDENSIPHPFMNFTQFWKIYDNSTTVVDPTQRYLPKQSNLTIYNSSRLLINLEGCVNTLRGECREFGEAHNKNGDNNTAQSRYRCYYNPADSANVIIRYDLDQTYKFLLITLIIPSVLFVVSSIALIVITKSVKVGDDAKMRCVCCSDYDDSQIDHAFATASKKNREKDVYELPDDVHLCEEVNINPMELQIEQPDLQNEMIGSTKSLIPLSPCEESLEKKHLDECNDRTKSCSEKSNLPLVII